MPTATKTAETWTVTGTSVDSRKLAVQRTYLVFDAAGGVSPFNSLTAGGESVGSSTLTTQGATAVCTSVSSSSIESAGGTACQLVVNYTSVELDEDFNAFSSEIGGSYVDCWRTQDSFGSGDPDANDIGGTEIDSAGVPVSKLCIQGTFSTTRRYTVPPWNALWGSVGKRNSDAYNGASVGSLLMRGISIQYVSIGLYEVQFKYEYDGFFHMRQVATREEGDSRIWLLNNHAKEVKNIQPFPDKVQFSQVIA